MSDSPRLAYAQAGPQRLARTPAMPARKARPVDDWLIIREHATTLINMMRSWRMSWMEHYQLLESYILPRRGIFINTAQPTPNSMIRGIPINQAILDPTGTYAMRVCAAGMMSGLMSPSRQWFKLKPALTARDEADVDALEWFEEVEDRIYTVMGGSNFYEAGAQMFEDLTTFGTGPMIIYEDDADLIRCYTPCCGEYLLGSSATNRVEPFARLFVMSVWAMVEMFGLENCPPDIQQLWREKGGSLTIEKLVAHIIEPNFAVDKDGDRGRVRGAFTWREAYWVWGSSDGYPLSLAGYADQPFVAPRWATTSNDPYGRSVGMDVLPDIMQLQVETSRKAEALEKVVRPPMLADMTMQNQPASILPGKVTFVSQLDAGKGMRPAFQVNPDLDHISADIALIQQRINKGFFNDLFAMLENLGDKRMTAFEVAQRNQEKLQILGPVVEKLQNEALGPMIKRISHIMDRRGLLPPLPPSLHGVPLGIEYVGVLALAQKASKTAALERFAATMNAQAEVNPAIMDNWDQDEWTIEYHDDLFLSERILRSREQVQQIRQQRTQQQQTAAILAGVQQAAQTGKDMSQIQIGGGMNAVSAMTGLGPDPGTQQQ